jgi:uncharacterized membrane protein
LSGLTSNPTPSAIVHGYLYSNGTFTTLDPPGSSGTTPKGINDHGEVVGSYDDSANILHGFIYDHGKYTILDDPLGTSTQAFGINNKDQIVGAYQDSSGYHGFIYDHGRYTTLDDPLGISTTLNGINKDGQIVGSYNDGSNSGNASVHGFVASPIQNKVGLGVDTFVFAPNSGHDTTPLLDVIQQHPQVELAAAIQQVAVDAAITHDAQVAIAPTDVHASNLHASAFHLV